MVSELIQNEGKMFLTALFWGMILAAEYDGIRIFRRVVRHKKVWTTSAEDIIFWMAAGIQVFCIIYENSNGIVRGFLIGAMVLGAVLYRYGLGEFFVKYVSKIVIFLLKPLKKLMMFIKIKGKKIAALLKQSIFRMRKKRRTHETGVKKRKRAKA